MVEGRKISFYSDAAHNYMVLECPPGLKDNYQYKMLAANRIKGLLSCSGRSIDSREYLYYDISSRQNLTDLYERRPVRGSDLGRILEDLVRVEETLTEYLLDTSHLILDPECVYLDFREQACSFAYYPGEEQENSLAALFSFLADRVDGRDKQAAALIYRLCMMAEKPGFRLRARVLSDLGMEIGKEGPDLKETYITKEYRFPYKSPYENTVAYSGPDKEGTRVVQESVSPGQGEIWDQRGERNPETGRDRWTGKEDGKRGEQRKKNLIETAGYGEWNPDEAEAADEIRRGKRREEDVAKSGLVRILPGLLAGLLIAAGIILFAMNRLVELGEREFLLTRAIGGVLTAGGIILLAVFLIRGRRKAKDQEAGTETEITYREPMPWEESSFACGEPADSREDYRNQSPWDRGSREMADFPRHSYTDSDDLRRLPAKQDASYRQSFGIPAGSSGGSAVGETCLLGPGSGPCAGLYGTGSCRGEQVSLAQLPCVVGAMREYVDQVVDDGSVSRMHARFSLDREGKMTVRDLNSTNGTWLNGERLQPNESRPLCQGDHLRLGRMEFVFR